MSSDSSHPEPAYSVFEDDRLELRIEIRPTEAIPNVSVGWLLGRLVNELRFRMLFAWLRYRDDDPERSMQIWGDLDRLVNHVSSDQSVRLTLREAIAKLKRGWEASFHSEWHLELLYGGEEHLLECRNGFPDVWPSEIGFILSLCNCPCELIFELRQHIILGLNPIEQCAFSLGELADELIHPQLSEKFYSLPPRSTASSGWNIQSAQGIPKISVVPRQCGSPFDNLEWRRRCEIAITEYVVAKGKPAHYGRLEWAALATPGSVIDAVESFFNEPTRTSSRHLNQENQDLLNEAGEAACRLRGLVLIGDRLSRQSDGSGHRLDNQKRRMAVYFLNNFDRPIAKTWLRENWNIFSERGKTPTIETIDSAVSAIRKVFSNFGLQIRQHENTYTLCDQRSSLGTS